MKKKLLTIPFILLLCFSLLIIMPPAINADPTLREVGTSDSLETALNDYANEDVITTIKLEADITYNKQITITKNLTFDLNGHTLLVEIKKENGDANRNESGLSVDGAGVELTLEDTSTNKTGAFNIFSDITPTEKTAAVNLTNGGKATVSNIAANNETINNVNRAWAAIASEGSTLTILENVETKHNGIELTEISDLHVKGNITHTGGYNGSTIWCDNSSITVDGNITAGTEGAWVKNHSTMRVKGNIISEERFGLYATNNCVVDIEGSINANEAGVSAQKSSNVTIDGDIIVNPSSYAENPYGISSQESSLVTMNGNIIVPNQADYVKAGASYPTLQVFTEEDGIAGTGENIGYMMYQHGGSTVRVSALQAPRITTQPTNKTLMRGRINDALTVEAEVAFNGTLSYQWYSNSTNSNSGGTEIVGASSSEYPLPEDLQLGDYYYYVVVTNTKDEDTKSKTSDVAKVTIEKATASIECELEDDESGIFLEEVENGDNIDLGEIPEDIESITLLLEVASLNNSERFKTTLSKAKRTLNLQGYQLYDVFDISIIKVIKNTAGNTSRVKLTNDEITGELTFFIPIPERFQGSQDPLAIAFINEQGEFELLIGRRIIIGEGNPVEYLEFTTDHLSLYGIINPEENIVIEELIPESSDKTSPETKEKVENEKTLPKTGGVSPSIFYLSGAMISGLGWILLKKRKNN